MAESHILEAIKYLYADENEKEDFIQRENLEGPYNITIGCWNINGKTNTTARKLVISRHLRKNPLLLHDGRGLDILFLQEVTVAFDRKVLREYISDKYADEQGVLNDYIYEEVLQRNGAIRNGVLLKEALFGEAEYQSIDNAYRIIDYKLDTYKWIKENYYRRKKAVEGGYRANEDLEEEKEKKMVEEALEECRRKPEENAEKYTTVFNNRCSNRYMTGIPLLLPDSVRDLLSYRMAAKEVIFQPQNIRIKMVVISYHAPAPQRNPERLTYNLFDFVNEIPEDVAVLIGGDFNMNITSCNRRAAAFRKFLEQERYQVGEYDLVWPRRENERGEKKIDFIMLRRPNIAGYEFNLIDMQAVDYRMQDIRNDGATNHSPLKATLEIRPN